MPQLIVTTSTAAVHQVLNEHVEVIDLDDEARAVDLLVRLEVALREAEEVELARKE